MTFQWPASLLGLLAVVAAAAWALYRPTRQQYVTPSLSLWQQALQSLDARRRRATRRINWAWVCLLAGALLAVLAAARPMIRQAAPSRRVAIAVYPSAETPVDLLNEAAGGLADRFEPEDRIQLILPELLGGSSGWLAPAQVSQRLKDLQPLPIIADRMELLSPRGTVQHVYHLAAAGSAVPTGPGSTLIELPRVHRLTSVQALDARVRADGTVEVFVSLQDHGVGRKKESWVHVTAWADAGDRKNVHKTSKAVTPGTSGRVDAVVEIPAAAVIQAGGPGSVGGFLIRRDAKTRTVALVGVDWPMARRFITADPLLELVSDPEQADIVVAHRTGPPRGKPALVVNPSDNPPGYARGKAMTAVVLRGRADASEDAVTRGVDVTPVAIRSVEPWRAGDLAMGKVLLSVGKSILILRNDPEASGGGQPRRVYAAFDPADENTNFCATEGFVVFMANAMRWLSPGGEASVRYECMTPEQAGPVGKAWTRWDPEHPRLAPTPLPWPGIYVDPAGRLEAVSLFGLRTHLSSDDPATVIGALTLPAPQAVAEPRELAGLLTILAIGLWLTGWTLRARTL